MEFLKEAKKKLDDGAKAVKGSKQLAMRRAVQDALLSFCEQDEEFAQAVAQGGAFDKCMDAVANGVGNSISDLEAFKKAVQFYFPGAGVAFQMRIDLCASVKDAEKEKKEPETAQERAEAPKKSKIINLEDFI